MKQSFDLGHILALSDHSVPYFSLHLFQADSQYPFHVCAGPMGSSCPAQAMIWARVSEGSPLQDAGWLWLPSLS